MCSWTTSGVAANSENSTLIRTRTVQSKLSMPQSRLDNSNAQSLETSYEEDDEEQMPEQSPMAVVKEQEETRLEEESHGGETSSGEMEDASHSSDATSEQDEEQTSSRRTRRQTKFYGDPVGSTVKCLFHHDDHIMEVHEITNREKSLSPEMLTNGRKKELEGWESFNVVSIVPVEEMMIKNKSPLSTRWVDVWKVDAYGTKTMKNILLHIRHTYSPTIGREVVILCLNVIVNHGWTTHTLDVKQAFLQSDALKREVYVVPPKEAELGDHLMWKLRVAVYGLSDASRSWYLTARRILEEIGLFESINQR